MDDFFIKKLPDGTWTQPSYRPDLANYTVEELLADNWFALVISPAPPVDFNQITVTTYEQQGNTVYQRHAFVLKQGAELTEAIKHKWGQIRHERNLLLQGSDWTQLEDAPLAADKKGAWATYRQQLRDITSQPDPFAIVWPGNPDGFNGTIGVTRV